MNNGISSVFHVGGLVSGIKTDDVIAKLKEIDSKSITDAQSRLAGVAKEKVAWSSLSAMLVGLKSAADRVAQPTSFKAYTATPSDPDAMSVSANGSAMPGTMSVDIKNLATSHQILSSGYAMKSSTVGTGTIKISVGAATYEDITIETGNGSLQGVADAINNANVGVQANLVNDGGADAPWHLVMTSKSTGAASVVKVEGTLGSQLTFGTMQAAQDAKIVVGGGTGGTGMTITSPTNTLADAVPGLSMQLLKPMDAVVVTTKSDTTAIRNLVQNFVTNYNGINNFFSQNMFYNAETKQSGLLSGDTDAVRLQDQLAQQVTGSNRDGEIRNLASMGITLDFGGQLVISDSAALDKAIQYHGENVKDFFSNTDYGLGKRVSAMVDNFQNPKSGILGLKLDSLKLSGDSLNSFITERQVIVDNQERVYREQFMRMETALSALQSQSNSVMSILSGATTSSTSSSSLSSGASAST